jgi:hypothetical protein
MKVPVKRFWLVGGRDLSGNVIYRQAHPLHYFSEHQMSVLLQALAAKSALTFNEIADALCRRDKRTALLEVQRLNGEHFTLACGPSFDWTARIIPDGNRQLTDVRGLYRRQQG